MKTLCARMDSNIRYRLRMCIWKHWKTPQNKAKSLITLGINKYTAWKIAYTGARIAYVCNKGAVNVAISNKRITTPKGVSNVKLIEPPCTERYAPDCLTIIKNVIIKIQNIALEDLVYGIYCWYR